MLELKDLRIISCKSSSYLLDKIEEFKSYRVGNSLTVFSNNEVLPSFKNSIRGKRLFIFQTFNGNPNDDLVELLFTADNAFASSAREINVVLPIVYGSRQDRKTAQRTNITISTIAKLLKSVHVNRVITTSLHSPQSESAFTSAGLIIDNLSTAEIFLPEMIELNKTKNFVIVSPDVGGLHKARYYAKILGADLAFGDKRRDSINKASILNLVGNVAGRNCFIVDDMIDTGGSIIKLAEKLYNEDAKDIYCLATHLILSGDAKNCLNGCPISKIYGTDSIKHDNLSSLFEIYSIKNLLYNTIKNIYCNESVGDLFANKV